MKFAITIDYRIAYSIINGITVQKSLIRLQLTILQYFMIADKINYNIYR